MKTINNKLLIKCLICLLVILFLPESIFGHDLDSLKKEEVTQQARLVNIEGDTLVLLPQHQLRLVNKILVDHDFLKETILIQSDIIENQSILISTKDYLIKEHESIITKQDDYYSDVIFDLKRAIEKEKSKNKWLLGGIGVSVGVIGALLIFN